MNRRTRASSESRRLFATRDTATSRRLLFVVGALMLITGLLMSWFERGTDDQRTAEESRSLAEQVHQRLGLDRDAPPSAFDQLLANLDRSAAPEPRPEVVAQAGFDVYVGTSTDYLLWFFEAVGYSADRVNAGETAVVPPLVLMSISEGWAEDKSVELKKSLFYRVVLPLVLLENQAVLAERARLVAYANKRRNRAPIAADEREALRALAVRYQVLEADSPAALDDAVIRELLLRVDAVPPSLALGQAAYESGYATSRFAYTGNALFGQWDWGEDALRPREQRTALGAYGVAAFDHPIDSVRAYLWNLNTHWAYEDFRTERARLRGTTRGPAVIDGLALAPTLASYSELGSEYTETLQGIIEHNGLQRADDLELIEGDPVYFD